SSLPPPTSRCPSPCRGVSRDRAASHLPRRCRYRSVLPSVLPRVACLVPARSLMIANVTIPTLAAELVVEILEHERGECESAHSDPRCPDCSTEPVALFTCRCIDDHWLICQRVVNFVAFALLDQGDCDCGLRVADCWSVVMLP